MTLVRAPAQEGCGAAYTSLKPVRGGIAGVTGRLPLFGSETEINYKLALMLGTRHIFRQKTSRTRFASR